MSTMIQQVETQEERAKRLNLEFLEKSFRFQEAANKAGLVLGEDGYIHNPNQKNYVEIIFWIVTVLVVIGFVYLLTLVLS
jgi:hypothetical protein